MSSLSMMCVPVQELSQRQEVRQMLQLTGGATSSIFPQVEALLIGGSDYAEALKYVAARKKTEKYWSMMDFFFCELFLPWRFHCFRYYEDQGPPLREMIDIERLRFFNEVLLAALRVAKLYLDEERRQSWRAFREEALKEVA